MTALAALAPVDEPRPDRARRTVAAELYEGTVAHRRHGSHARSFTPRLFLAHLDVDALPGSLDRLPGWSARRAAPLHFRRRDYLDGGDAPLGDAVRDLVQARLGRRPAGPVTLLAQLRTFGWLFNPLAVYWCWSPAGGLDAVVLEVSNTPWGERTWYVLDARDGTRRARVGKQMHVSPFLPTDGVEYRVSWTEPGDDLHLRIDVRRAGVPLFDATLDLHRVALDRRRAVTMPVRHWLLPLRVSAGIYLEAAKLWLRGAPVHRHPRREAAQR